MKRRMELALVAVMIILGGAALLFLGRSSSDGFQDKPAPRRTVPGPKEITIRNVTKEPVSYTLQPFKGQDGPAARTLAVGAIDRFPAVETVTVTYKKYGHDVSYGLYPGKPYSFRYDSSGKIDIWQGAHGRADAEDLAPFVPTPPEVVDKMLEMARVAKDDVVYDIGCGDGRIVIAAASKYGARGVGIDIDPERIVEAEAGRAKAGVDKLVKFKLADATKVDLSDATVVTLYLLPESNELLRPKFEKELKPGTRVVTHNYIIPGWEKKEVTNATLSDPEGTEHSVFLYKR